MLFESSKRKIKELTEKADRLNDKISGLEKENIQMHAILGNMAEGVIAVDRETRVISFNPTIERIFNTAKQDAEGKFFLESFRNNDLSEVINEVLQNGKFISRELNLIWPLQRIFQVNASAIFEKEKISGCLMVIHDITEVRKLEKMRSDFVANVSHELKTPLTSIKGFVETLLEGALDDKENNRHFIEIIQDHAERLNSLINDLLDLSAVESKQLQLQIEEFNLKNLTDEGLSGFKVQLKKKNLVVSNVLSDSLLVRADKVRVEQVLINLVDNAIKFNKENGFIKIYSEDLPAYPSGRGVLSAMTKVIIEDSGIGIPPKDIPRIFERFYRVDKARSRELGGTGLGLSIVKHIVELHGGSVGVESTEGLGSKFWFILPK